MKYLITGINGQLGHDLYKILNDGKNEVFAPTSLTLNLTDPVTIYKSVLEFHPDVIIHGAAYTAVDKAEEEKEYAELVNAVGTSRLVDAAKMVNAKIIYVSTDYVFDGTKKAPYKVYDDVNPLNWYGKTKRLGEEAVLDYEKMKQAAQLFVGKHDFSAFCTPSGDVGSTVREIVSVDVVKGKGEFDFYICGKGFLYNMVRYIVGTIVKAGKNKISSEEIVNALTTGDKSKVGEKMPPEGLYLYKVTY